MLNFVDNMFSGNRIKQGLDRNSKTIYSKTLLTQHLEKMEKTVEGTSRLNFKNKISVKISLKKCLKFFFSVPEKGERI